MRIDVRIDFILERIGTDSHFFTSAGYAVLFGYPEYQVVDAHVVKSP